MSTPCIPKCSLKEEDNGEVKRASCREHYNLSVSSALFDPSMNSRILQEKKLLHLRVRELVNAVVHAAVQASSKRKSFSTCASASWSTLLCMHSPRANAAPPEAPLYHMLALLLAYYITYCSNVPHAGTHAAPHDMLLHCTAY
eukprot:gene8769-33636_t